MQDEDWDDEEPIYPRAPLPPHERVWRHPSELGFVAQQRHLPPPPRIPRVVFVGAGALAVAAAAGIVMLLAPRSGTNVVQTASQPVTTRNFGETDDTAAASSTEPSTSTKPRRSTTVADRTTTEPLGNAHSLSTMSVSGAARFAVAVGDGRHALTTAEALSTDQTVEVEVGDGSVVAARVLIANTDHNIAVLELERVMTRVARQVTYKAPKSGDRVLVGQNEIEAIVESTERGLRVITDADAAAQNGEPVMSDDGKLVGLISRSSDGSLRLVTIPRLAALKATILVIDVWLGLRFESDSLHVVEANAQAPAALAGIEPGDALTAINHSTLTCIDDLWVELAFMKAGQTVTLEFLRDGVAHAVDVTLVARPS